MTALELIFQYRRLQNQCELGLGLEIDEIDALSDIEAAFTIDPAQTDLRRHRRETVTTTAILRGRHLNDRVAVTELAPGGLVCADAPSAVIGEVVDVIFDDHDLRASYRFKATVCWVQPAPDDGAARMGLAFVGAPVCIHYGAEPMPSSPMFDRIPTLHAA
ncbi:MAG: PilZ domain-containing protein [Kofleriaceae bacterium]